MWRNVLNARSVSHTQKHTHIYIQTAHIHSVCTKMQVFILQLCYWTGDETRITRKQIPAKDVRVSGFHTQARAERLKARVLQQLHSCMRSKQNKTWDSARTRNSCAAPHSITAGVNTNIKQDHCYENKHWFLIFFFKKGLICISHKINSHPYKNLEINRT